MGVARKFDVDKAGAIAGTICAVHCLLTGLALGLLSVAGLGFLGSAASEAAFIGVALLLGAWAVRHGIRRHHSWIPAMVFVLGLGCIATSHFAFEHAHSGERGSLGSVVFAVAGGLCLTAFHIVNSRLAHRCGCNCR